MMSLALTGATATFTGCIDTDEPNGISELRSAKSELIRAQAELKRADVEFRNAETEFKKAEVEGLKIANRLAEIAVEKEQLELDLLTAVNDEKIKLELQKLEQERAQLVENHEAIMLGLQEATAKAKESYDNALAAIAAAKLLLTDDEQKVIDKAVANLKKAEGDMHDALAKVYDAQDVLNGAIKDDLTNDDGAREAALKHAIVKAEHTLAVAEKGVEEIQKLIDKDVPTTNWEKEVAELEATILAHEVKVSEAKADKKRIEIAHKADKDNVEALEEVYEDANEAEIELAEYKLPINNEYAKTKLGKDEFKYTEGKFTNVEYLDEQGKAVDVIDEIDQWLEDVDNAGASAEVQAQARLDQRLKKIEETDAAAELTPYLNAWRSAVTAFNAQPNDPALESDLIVASSDAFGGLLNESGKSYRLTQPTDEEVAKKAKDLNVPINLANFGYLGPRVAATLAWQEANNIVDSSVDLTNLKEALLAQKEVVEKIAEDNKTAVAAAKKAWKDAKEAYDDLFVEVNDLISYNQEMADLYEELSDLLKGNIAQYLDGEENYEDFLNALKDQLHAAEDGVVAAMGDLDEAKHDLEMFKKGEYTAQYEINKAKAKLETAMELYKIAKGQYDHAYATTQEVLSTLMDIKKG